MNPNSGAIRIYGVDFSGARDPSGKLFVASGTLAADGSAFDLERVAMCDDRLDAFAMMLRSPAGSIWGWDVPFAPAGPAYDKLGFTAWEEWLSLAAGSSRSSFLEKLDAAFPPFETPCAAHGWACRHTDVVCRAASPFKRVQPNLRAMIYAGWKLLAYAREAGCAVFPFDDAGGTRGGPTLYEVYPSHTARLAGGARRLDLSAAAEATRAVAGWRLPPATEGVAGAVPSQDAADACVACLTLAAAYARERASLAGGGRPSFATDAEWAARRREGLIVRLAE
ncbi:hypothetical protein FE782_07650 [Paenibacillus antri]|uniref:DUF429 domain-containing protein n=1 Tax=Paenibacillus antri TaxID=2582848 RepID=A0A5R9G9V9_9BACL|nr:hypothetical protein [Paenibacillus antri]TLS53227.1 hypothetical protein FE782_07650 [Paenibacillus antri]